MKGSAITATKSLSNGNKSTSQKERTALGKMTTSGAASMSKSWAKVTTTTSNTTKLALAKFDSSPAKRSASLANKQEAGKVGARRTQSVQASKSTFKSESSPPGQKPQVTQGQKLNGNSSLAKDPETTKSKRVVKEKLKVRLVTVQSYYRNCIETSVVINCVFLK